MYKKALIAITVAAGLYTYSSAAKFVDTLSDKEAHILIESMPNSNLEQPLYASMVKSMPPDNKPDLDSKDKV